MSRAINSAVIPGVLIGAAAMYLADPDRGSSRRAWIRRQAVHGIEATESKAMGFARGALSRLTGLFSRGRQLVGLSAGKAGKARRKASGRTTHTATGAALAR